MMLEEPMIVVYQIKNLTNGKVYIGITRSGLRHRRYQHLWNARHNRGHHLGAAIRKYGEHNFMFSIIKICETYDKAMEEEIRIIAALKPAYNLTNGGEGTVNKRFYSPEERKRLGKSAIGNKYWVGRKHRPESIEKMRQKLIGRIGPWAGKKRPPETIERMCLAKQKNPTRYWLGKKRSKETIEKIRATKETIGYYPKPTEKSLIAGLENMRLAHIRQRKRVVCINDDLIFESGIEAAKFYGVCQPNLSEVCLKKKSSIKGLIFAFASEEAAHHV